MMLFCHVSLREAHHIKEDLLSFMEASGTMINNEKSYIFIFDTPKTIQPYLAQVLGFEIGSLPSKYLGMYLSVNSLKKILLEISAPKNQWEIQ